MYGDVFVRHARTRDVGTQHAEKASNAEPRNATGRDGFVMHDLQKPIARKRGTERTEQTRTKKAPRDDKAEKGEERGELPVSR